MAMIRDKEALGEYADAGYYLKEYDDHVVTVCFKEQELAAFNQGAVIPAELQAVCLRHKNRMNGNSGIKLCRDCTHWHYTADWRGNCYIHRWDKDKYSQDATPTGCPEYALRCVATAQEG